MTLQTKLSRIGSALVTALTGQLPDNVEVLTKDIPVHYCDVYHYWRPQMQAPFCVWAEDGEGTSFHADDKKQEQVVTGFVDYYTKTEYDSALDVIQDTLNTLMSLIPFAWVLNSVQYEEDTNLIHYEWRWELA